MTEILQAIVPLIEQGGWMAFWLAVLYLMSAPLRVLIAIAGLYFVAKLIADAVRYCNPPDGLCWSCHNRAETKRTVI